MTLSSASTSVIAIVGPTASGKSELGINLALRFNGEIINCDSVQVYTEIEIATAKVPVAQRRGVPHHLIDYVPPNVDYTAGEWARAALEKIEEIESRGAIPFIVGGTGFYLRALRRPFFPSPATDKSLRRRLTMLRDRRGMHYLHDMLKRVDPESAQRLSPRDWPRVQRALEVRFQTGLSMSKQLALRGAPHPRTEQIRVFALSPPRSKLYERINRRTEEHFEKGLVDEVRALLERGVAPESNALGAHGYRRVVEYLGGKRDLNSAIEQTKLDVRHYAKRQLTWFRREPGVTWIEGFGDDPQVISRIQSIIERLISSHE